MVISYNIIINIFFFCKYSFNENLFYYIDILQTNKIIFSYTKKKIYNIIERK